MSQELSLSIPIEPPSGNHYKRPNGKGGQFITKEAKSFYQAVSVIARGETVEGDAHEVTYVVYQGFGKKGDVDNYAKCILDSLVKCGVLKSDASVVSLHAHKLRDRENPRTEIRIKSLQEKP